MLFFATTVERRQRGTGGKNCSHFLHLENKIPGKEITTERCGDGRESHA